jgi:DNA-binding MarR family transcriptional regulator
MNSSSTAQVRASDDTMFSLIRAAHQLEERLEAALGGVGLSTPKHSVLSELVNAGKPLTLSELAARLSCVRSNITQLVDRLESDGLVRRVDDPQDRRSILAELTPLGREKQAAGASLVAGLKSDLAERLSAADKSALQRILGAL